MLTLSLNELLAYTDEERAKWHRWLRDNPFALELQLQPGGRFATVGALIDHMFLVEARHLARLQGATVPESSGIAPPDVEALFRYGAAVRLSLRNFASSLSDEDAAKVREFVVQSGTAKMSPRKLLFHIGLHEIRHWAQIALGIRQAAIAPPGNHDLFYSSALS
jgi:uncharacterized damage-inducible protein DinB